VPELTPGALVLVLAGLVIAGFVAGVLNSVVGSGSLVTFPALIAIGVPPLPATLTSSVGLTLSNFSGPWGYRAMLAAQGRRLLMLLPVAGAGGLTGSLLLTALPSTVFATLAPLLILLAVVLVVVQPLLQRAISARRSTTEAVPPLPGPVPRGVMIALMFLASVYGGYFVAAQGVFMFGILGAFIGGDLRYVNALKNALASLINLLSATVYVITSFDRIVWPFVAAVAAGAGIGGLLGVRIARRVPGAALRWLIVAIGVAGLLALLLRPSA